APSPTLPAEPRLEEIDRSVEIPLREGPPTRAGHERRLHMYGSTPDAQFIHVPIEHAMELLAGKLPVREQSDEPHRKDHGLVGSGDPNSGRLLRKEPAW